MLLTTIGGFLASKGLELLGGLFTKGTEKGVEAIGNMVEDKLGIDITNEDTIKNLSPEDIVKLQEFENAHKSDILNYLIAEKQIYNDNTANARSMQMEALRMNSSHASFTNILAGVLIVFSLVYISAITFMEVPKDNVRFADTSLGFILGTMVGTIINYYFGSAIPSTKPSDIDFTLSPTKDTASSAVQDALQSLVKK